MPSSLTPADFGLSLGVHFQVRRGAEVGTQPAPFADILDFLGACGIDTTNEALLAAIFQGIPFAIDGAMVSISPLPEPTLSPDSLFPTHMDLCADAPPAQQPAPVLDAHPTPPSHAATRPSLWQAIRAWLAGLPLQGAQPQAPLGCILQPPEPVALPPNPNLCPLCVGSALPEAGFLVATPGVCGVCGRTDKVWDIPYLAALARAGTRVIDARGHPQLRPVRHTHFPDDHAAPAQLGTDPHNPNLCDACVGCAYPAAGFAVSNTGRCGVCGQTQEVWDLAHLADLARRAEPVLDAHGRRCAAVLRHSHLS